MDKKIHYGQLCYELYLAGIPVKGANSDGVIWDMEHNDISQRPDVLAVIEAHVPNPEPENECPLFK
jgi:hypothetical protein